jgi:hypothetical protein
MTENLPSYVSIVFILTTFLTVGFLLNAVKKSGATLPSQIFIFLLTFWLFFTAILSIYGFYTITETFPPRIFAFGAMPALIVSIIYIIFFRKNFIENLPLKTLTLLHIIRIPVEMVLYWLFQNGLIPQIMTFEGRNFDILSGISAPIIFWLAFRNGQTNRPLLIIWNVLALILLVNIVTTAILAFPSPMQQIAFEQPNRGVMFFPFVWLPAIVVPIVFFSHLASLWILCQNSLRERAGKR